MYDPKDLLVATTQIAVALAARDSLRESGTIGHTIASIYAQLAATAETPKEEKPVAPEYQPAVSVRKSLASSDHIVSMIDGKPYKTLRRHLATHGLTPEQYRERYGLKDDYPMVAASYSERRSEMAKNMGLGRKKKG